VDAILLDVASGALRCGDRVDSERVLTRRFDVSLGTAQRALRELQDLGVLIREHGRGTFVKRTETTVYDARFIRFRNPEGAILPIHAKVLSVRRSSVTSSQRAFFGSSQSRFVKIVRRIDVGGQFDLISEFILPESDFDQLLMHDGVDGNIRERLAGALALPTLRVEQFLSFSTLPAYVWRLLGLRHSGEGFRMELRAYTLQDRPLYLQSVFGLDFGGATLVIER
jgi:DNA-binding GntR family transcriptional regulator